MLRDFERSIAANGNAWSLALRHRRLPTLSAWYGTCQAVSHANYPCQGVSLQAGSVVALVRPTTNR
jgi:hypothetical protein